MNTSQLLLALSAASWTVAVGTACESVSDSETTGGEGGAPDSDATGGEGGAPPNGFLEGDRTGKLPATLSELGVYGDLKTLSEPHPSTHAFEPLYPLWTNGSGKHRLVSVPAGKSIETESEIWEFPQGTLFVKTFTYPNGEGRELPIETRVTRITKEGAEFFAYQWDPQGEDAVLLDGKKIHRVSVTVESDTFEHEIPSLLQCRSCHESSVDPVLGFDAFRLNFVREGEEEDQLQLLARAKVLSEVGSVPEPLERDDELTAQVLGYFEGNCVHCHNGSEGPASAFDLGHKVAEKNLIGVDTTSELLHGIRVVPGAPEESVVYQALVAEPTSLDSQPMPPAGVQRKDVVGIELVREWIQSLDSTASP